MGELGLNKIMGALLATALGLMGLATLPSLVFGGEGGHHGDHEEPETLSEKMCTQFHYCVEIAEAASTGEAEAVFDLPHDHPRRRQRHRPEPAQHCRRPENAHRRLQLFRRHEGR